MEELKTGGRSCAWELWDRCKILSASVDGPRFVKKRADVEGCESEEAIHCKNSNLHIFSGTEDKRLPKP